MSVKVVQGLVGGVKPGQPQNQTETQPKPPVVNAQAHLPAAQTQSSEAVLTSVRLTRFSSQTPDKIRDSKEAKRLADDIAEKITEKADKGDPQGANPHKGLETLSAPEQLLN